MVCLLAFIYIYFLLQETIIHVSDNISYTLEILGISINPPRLVNRSCWTPVTTQPLVRTQWIKDFGVRSGRWWIHTSQNEGWWVFPGNSWGDSRKSEKPMVNWVVATQTFFMFTRIPGEMIQFDYFSNGLKPPTSKWFLLKPGYLTNHLGCEIPSKIVG